MKKFFTLFTLLCFVMNTQAQVIPISQARQVAQGQPVEISGIVINGASLGPIRYIQDATGGLPVYDPTVTNTWNQGDSVTVAGVMGDFNGLIQITNTTSNTVHSTGNALPMPTMVNAPGINATTEATLLTVNDITFSNGGGTFTSGTLSFTDNNGAVSQIYLRSGHPLVGTTIPLAKVDLTGIASVFAGSYQLLPREVSDVQIASNFYFTSSPEQSNLAKTSFDVSWMTSSVGSTNVRYGTTDMMSNMVNQGGSTMNHTVSLTGLTPGEIYYVQAYSVSGTDTITSPMAAFATVSNSSGQIEVIFNQLVDVSVSTGTNAVNETGGQIEGRIIDMIDNAQNTIDICIYSIGRGTVISALNAAHNRGVQVRFITNTGSNNPALQTVTPQFPFIAGNPNALMHNKFIITDVDSEDSCMVMMGSMNFNNDEMGSNYNSVLFIQDQSLAKTYRLEFQEMWGSNGPNPGIFNVKFGAAKTNNTPHNFLIGGIPIECYFSPSDGTTNKIIEAIESADSDLSFALFSFTRNDIRDAIIAEHNSGTAVRGMIENINDTGGEYNNLLNAGVPMKAHPESFLLHHKYGFVDDTNPNSDPTTITGSHNWSSAAENSNDENTLIIHDATITNMYAQEFNARWLGWVTNTTVVANLEGFKTNIYPNPARDFAEITVENNGFENVVLSVYDMKGQLLKTVTLNAPQGTSQHRLDVTDLPSGQYALLFNLGEFGKSTLLQVAK